MRLTSVAKRRSDIGLGLRDQLVWHPTSGGNADEHCTRSVSATNPPDDGRKR
jgi:hypothetical protein